jgi:hypothetical protein
MLLVEVPAQQGAADASSYGGDRAADDRIADDSAADAAANSPHRAIAAPAPGGAAVIDVVTVVMPGKGRVRCGCRRGKEDDRDKKLDSVFHADAPAWCGKNANVGR